MRSSEAPRLGVALLLTAAFLRAGPTRPRAWIGALYAAGAIAYLLWGAAGSASWPWRLHGLVGILALSCPFFVWALARSIFEDDFCGAAHWIILAVIVITGVAQSALARVLDPWIVTTSPRRLSAAIARADRSCLRADVERMAGQSCRQACAAAFRRSDLCRDLRRRPATICGRMASRERKDHEAMGRLVLLGNARGRVLNARCNIRRA